MADTTSSQPVTARKGLFSSGRGSGRKLPLGYQLLFQGFCLLVTASVVFPILWIVTLSLGAPDEQRPSVLRLLPPSPTLASYQSVIDQPLSGSTGGVDFWDLMGNSFFLAAGVSFFSVLIGVSAAYAFSRLDFPGRKLIFLSIGFILLMPAIATLAPLFALLTKIQLSQAILRIVYLAFGGVLVLGAGLMAIARLRDGDFGLVTGAIAAVLLAVGGLLLFSGLKVDEVAKPFILSRSLYGVGFAMISGALPFAIWNLKGYLDTIPKELEEAAIIDGASANQIFFRIILPLATPALAVTAFLGFMSGWTEFALTARFIDKAENYTLAVALQNMIGQYSTVPWSKFAAMSMIISLPVSIVYLALQKYIVGGLTLGGVKG